MYGITRLAHRRYLRPHQLDPQYHPVAKAVLRHLQSHATINLVQSERMLSLRGITVMRYLDQMERDGLVKLHSHNSTGAFYTLP